MSTPPIFRRSGLTLALAVTALDVGDRQELQASLPTLPLCARLTAALVLGRKQLELCRAIYTSEKSLRY